MDIPLTRGDITSLIDNIIDIYLTDDIPWVVGYSGGKDSTAALQLVWNALKKAGIGKQGKTVHVITVDTLVESPVVSAWVKRSLEMMLKASIDLPISVHTLTPPVNQTYWVNLIGKGYPFPKPSFRWCTDRLKIKPTNNFVQEMVALHGEVIMVLGTRKAESVHRQQTLEKFKKMRTRKNLNPSTTMTNALVYPLLEDWSNDNVWQYLMMEKNPWGLSNKELLTMYKGASADGECPLVLSTDTPSCGNSRFGCWVCTLVEKDKSMAAMISNDKEKAWMSPLLELRNEIGDISKENSRRDFRRMNGSIKLQGNRLIHGPYRKEVREEWLERLLTIQEEIRSDHNCDVENFTIIRDEELREIRRIWLHEKYQFDDSLPIIYERATGKKYFDIIDQKRIFGKVEWDLLKETTNSLYPNETLLFELQTNLLALESRSSNMRYRKGILSSIENAVQHFFFRDELDALNYSLECQSINSEFENIKIRNQENETTIQLNLEED